MKQKNHVFHMICLSAALIANNSFAEIVGGTGTPQIQLQVTEDQRAVLSLSEGPTVAIGSANLEQAYAELPLDAFSTTSSQTDWGKAEVLFGCGVADVLVYQQRNGQWIEVLAEQVITDACIE